ncbi:MAG: PAS domain S-box protein [Proteobacteria bacterium]|nr:PAS domain S-box protein [Pseudomonadota bacterium]
MSNKVNHSQAPSESESNDKTLERDSEAQKWHEMRYRALFDNSPDMIFEIDLQGQLIGANDRTLDVLGYKRDELSSFEFRDVLEDEFVPIALESLSRVIQNGSESGPSEYCLKNKNGRRIWVETNTVLLKQDGEPTSLLGIARDITERKETERKLKESEESLKKAQAVAHVGSWEWNLIDNSFLLSDEMHRIYGLSDSETINNLQAAIDAAIHPEDKTHVIQAAAQVIQDGVGESIIYRIIRPDGEIRWVKATRPNVKVFGKDGSPLVMIGTVEDITESKLAKEELRESEARFRTIASTAKDAIIEMDQYGRISFWNAAASDIFGYCAEEAGGRNIYDLLGPRERTEEHRWAFPEFQSTETGDNERRTFELVAVRKDGVEISIELSLGAVNVVDSWQVVAVVRDITERKLIETELKKAKEEAEAANQAKTRFLANVSHELRTPLNAIMGMNQLLLYTNLTEEQRECTEIAQQSIRHLKGVIGDILDISRIEAENLIVKVIDFDLVNVIEEVADTVAKQAEDKGLVLNCVVKSGIPTLLKGDPKRLRQILINMAGNALKFTNQGELKIETRPEQIDETTATLRFVVSDTGIGIPKKQFEDIFKLFTQADDSYTRNYGGTGLGLAISKELVEMMGGRIGVESEVGKGSTFWFTLTFEKQPGCLDSLVNVKPDYYPRTRSEATKRPFVPGSPGARANILVVEDEPFSQKVALRFLERLGCRVKVVENGKEALDALQAAHYDLVLMDIQMAVMNGIEATRAIRDPQSKALNRDIPIVAMTAHAFTKDRERCKEAGMNDYITKPMDISELHKIIEKYLPTLLHETSRPSTTEQQPQI